MPMYLPPPPEPQVVWLRAGDTVTSLCGVPLVAPFVMAENGNVLFEIEGATAKLIVRGVTVASVSLR